jgi:hypothetical protein
MALFLAHDGREKNWLLPKPIPHPLFVFLACLFFLS